MGIFGWSYPAGSEFDPLAPWNQEDEAPECPNCGEYMEDSGEGDFFCPACEEDLDDE